VFSDVLETARELLEPGKNVVVTAEATLEGETLKLLARAVAPIDAVAADAPSAGVRIHLERAEAAAAVAALFAGLGRGGPGAPVRFCVPGPKGEEIDVELPGTHRVNPQVKGAIKATPGVLLVEDL
jgi:DNA polymerase-3 subunit alpha